MSLSVDLIHEFAKLTNDTNRNATTNNTLYGTIVEYENSKWVRIDGSDLLTPISTVTNVSDGDRVIVGIQNHTAIVNGNLTSPSATNRNVQELDEVVAGKVSADEMEAQYAEFQLMLSQYAKINYVEAEYAKIETLESDYAKIAALDAESARVNQLLTNYATVEVLESNYATIANLQATNARIDEITSSGIDTGYLHANFADINLSNITKAVMKDFYANSGLISNATINNGVITGDLVGVTISGDLIKANTVVADKLVVQGDNGLYYKLNTDGMKVEAQQTDSNSLNGSIISAKSIAATKINVSDLVAFGATIGGFNITDSAIHSYLKDSVNNIATGVYLDKNGQMSVGDGNNYIKYYKDTDDSYKLKIAANEVIFSTTGKTVQQTINDVKVGGRNIIRGAGNAVGWSNYTSFNQNEREFTKSTTSTSESLIYCNNKFDLVAGETYTLSFKAKQNGYVKHGEVYILPHTFEVTGIAFNNIFAVDTEYKEYKFTFVPNPKATSLVDCKLRFDNNGSTAAGTEAIIYIKDIKFEKGDKATDWTPAPEDIDADISNASKTATNYLSFSNNGLVVGDMTASSLGKNVLIDSDSVDIRNGTTTLASFKADRIELGKNSTSSVISLCGDTGTIKAKSLNNSSVFDTLEFASDNLSLSAPNTHIKTANTSGYADMKVYTGNIASGDHVGEYVNAYIGSNSRSSYGSSASVSVMSFASYNDASTVNINARSGAGKVSSIIVDPNSIEITASELTINSTIYAKGTIAGREAQFTAIELNRNGLLQDYGGFIDFHFNGSTSDYTSRIIEETSGTITVVGSLKVNYGLHASGSLYLPKDGTDKTRSIYGVFPDGSNIELMRVINTTSTPSFNIGGGLYNASIGETNIYSGNHVRLITRNNTIEFYDTTGDGYTAQFRPNTKGKVTLGAAAYTWFAVYAANATIQTSDRRVKENILPIGDKHSELFDRLQPVQYNFIEGNGRTCYGLIAQDVISIMDELGIGENELDLVHHEYHTNDETGEEFDTYGIAYDNLISLLINEVQKLKAEMKTLKGENNHD